MDPQTEYRYARYMSITLVIVGVALAGMGVGTYLGYDVSENDCGVTDDGRLIQYQNDSAKPACAHHMTTLASWTNYLSLLAIGLLVSGFGCWIYIHRREP